MAQCRPKEVPDEIKKEPFRSAEILVFNALKKLPDSFHVLYGVTWNIKKQDSSWAEGEADFVVVSPSVGIVIIEVKGGQIGRDLNCWYSIDRNGVKHTIKDPVTQASRCKHNILKYLIEQNLFNNTKLPTQHMVCFPNVLLKDSRTLIELPKEMQIFADDLSNIQNKIEKLTEHCNTKTHKKLTIEECAIIADTLKPNFDYPTRWSLQVERQNQIINSLTDEQAEIWNVIGENQHMSLSGPAGSGKTILAIKLAKQYINENKRVLVLVPSHSLRDYYNQSLDYKSDCKNYNVYEHSAQVNISSIKKYDLIVIDEAQDMSDETWNNVYRFYDIKKCKCLLVIFDSNQRLKNICQVNPFENLVPLNLTKVVRNTKQIATFVTQFYNNKVATRPVGPDGLKVEYTICEPKDTLKVILELVNKYISVDGFNYSDIVVLFGNKYHSKQENRRKLVMKNQNNKYGITLRSFNGYKLGSMYKNPFIATGSISMYRGLESKIVILCNIDSDDISNLKNECYVGASRARNILHIVADEKTVKQISFN